LQLFAFDDKGCHKKHDKVFFLRRVSLPLLNLLKNDMGGWGWDIKALYRFSKKLKKLEVSDE